MVCSHVITSSSETNGGFIDLYLSEDSEHAVALPSEVQRELMMSLRAIVNLDSSFDMTQRYLLHKMYNNQFQVCSDCLLYRRRN